MWLHNQHSTEVCVYCAHIDLYYRVFRPALLKLLKANNCDILPDVPVCGLSTFLEGCLHHGFLTDETKPGRDFKTNLLEGKPVDTFDYSDLLDCIVNARCKLKTEPLPWSNYTPRIRSLLYKYRIFKFERTELIASKEKIADRHKTRIQYIDSCLNIKKCTTSGFIHVNSCNIIDSKKEKIGTHKKSKVVRRKRNINVPKEIDGSKKEASLKRKGTMPSDVKKRKSCNSGKIGKIKAKKPKIARKKGNSINAEEQNDSLKVKTSRKPKISTLSDVMNSNVCNSSSSRKNKTRAKISKVVKKKGNINAQKEIDIEDEDSSLGSKASTPSKLMNHNLCSSTSSGKARKIRARKPKIVEKQRNITVRKRKTLSKKKERSTPTNESDISSNSSDDSDIQKKIGTAKSKSSIAQPGKIPTKGSLKRKRWLLKKMETDENYEDDIFEKRPFYRLSDLDEISTCSSDYTNVGTPSWCVALTPNRETPSPVIIEEFDTVSELQVYRKNAEEYLHRRKKRRTGEINSPNKPPTSSKQQEEAIDRPSCSYATIKVPQQKDEDYDSDEIPDSYFSDPEESSGLSD